MILVNHYAIWPPIPKTIFIKHCRVEIIACPFVLFHNDRFFHVCCLFHQRFSAAYLLKLFLLPQRAHTTLFIRCDKPELTRWCLCSLYSGIQMSPFMLPLNPQITLHCNSYATKWLLMFYALLTSQLFTRLRATAYSQMNCRHQYTWEELVWKTLLRDCARTCQLLFWMACHWHIRRL